MSRKKSISFFCSLILVFFSSFYSFSQIDNKKTTRILFILDGSSSMTENWSGSTNRYDAGRFLIHDIMDSIYTQNPNVEFGLRVFGHNYTVEKNNCLDTRMEVRFSPLNSEMVNGRLGIISPQGVSPIALTLRESAEVDIISSKKYAYSIILITDGYESCGGDLCMVMQSLLNQKINFTPYIVSLNNDPTLVNQYDCMGQFMTVTNRSDFVPVIQKIMNDNNYFIATDTTVFIPQTSYNNLTVVVDTPKVDVAPNDIIDTPFRGEDKNIDIEVPGPDNKNIIQYDVKDPEGPKKFTSVKMINTTINTTSLLNYPKSTKPVLTKTKVNPLPQFTFIIDEPPVATDNNTVKPPLNNKIDTPITNIVKPKEIKTYPLLKKFSTKTEYTIKPLALAPSSVKITKMKINPLPKFNLPKDEEVVVKNTTTPPINTNSNPPKKDSVTYHTNTQKQVDIKDQRTIVKTEDKSDTNAPGTMQIYFTNGHGKYYTTSPKIEIKDNATGTIVWKGHREFSNGVPAMITVPNGSYTVSLSESGRFSQVTIENGKNKRVEIVVGGGNLAFTFTGTNEIPKGYVATVSKQFEKTEIVEHPTDKVLQYEAATYHIEINTLPLLMYNVKVDFDNTTMVSIPKPGTIQIINEEEMGRIEFWHNLAGQPYRFYEMSIYGDVEFQKVDLRPGTYEIRYPFVTESGERVMKVKRVTLKSEQELQILLN